MKHETNDFDSETVLAYLQVIETIVNRLVEKSIDLNIDTEKCSKRTYINLKCVFSHRIELQKMS